MEGFCREATNRRLNTLYLEICMRDLLDDDLFNAAAVHDVTSKIWMLPLLCLCVSLLSGYCNWPGDDWLLSSSPLPAIPSAHPLTHAGGLTSSRDVFLSSSSPLSSAHSQFFQPSFWRKMNVCWLTRLGVTESALSMAALSVPRPPLLSPSLSAAAHSVCGLREPWSPVTPWISGCAVGGCSLLFH